MKQRIKKKWIEIKQIKNLNKKKIDILKIQIQIQKVQKNI